MAWYRVDDGFPDHPKLEVLERDPVEHALAVAAWTLMGADCAKRRTDGRFTEARLRRVLPWPEDLVRRGRDALLSAACGLWERESDDVIAFHDWEDYQPTKSELDADRKAATERQKRWRQRRRQERAARDAVDASTNGVTHAVTDDATAGVTDARQDPSPRDTPVDGTPSRPVPTRPDHGGGDQAAPTEPEGSTTSADEGTRESEYSEPPIVHDEPETLAGKRQRWFFIAWSKAYRAAKWGIAPDGEGLAKRDLVRILSEQVELDEFRGRWTFEALAGAVLTEYFEHDLPRARRDHPKMRPSMKNLQGQVGRLIDDAVKRARRAQRPPPAKTRPLVDPAPIPEQPTREEVSDLVHTTISRLRNGGREAAE